MARNKYPEQTLEKILNTATKLFIEKGYEHTNIQDIMDTLAISKGGIYHHFKSKEEIFEAVCMKIANENNVFYEKIRDDKSKNGYEKLKMMIQGANLNPNRDATLAMSTKIMSDPKFMINQITEIYELITPVFIQPIIEQGIYDGSIKTTHPKELAEVIITLLNIWMNPIIASTTPNEMRNKFDFFNKLLLGIGIDILDQEIIEQYVEILQAFKSVK